MDSDTLTQAILETERIGVILFVVVSVVGAAIVAFGALSGNDEITALMAGMTVVSGVVVLGIIVYMELYVWDSA